MARRVSLGLLSFLAARGLRQSPLITAMMVAAVAGGVAFQIPNSANIRGYNAEILERGVTEGFGDVRLRPESGQRIDGAAAIVTDVAARPGVRSAVPILTLPGALGRDGGFKNTLVVGVDADARPVPFTMTAGERLATGDDAGVVVGAALAERLELSVGDEVQLRVIMTMSDGIADEDSIGRYTMSVRGIASGMFVAPSAVMVDRGFLAAELGEPAAASIILVHARDHYAARHLATELDAALPAVEARAWMDDDPFLQSALDSSAAVGAVSHAMVMLAVLIPVWALLFINVLHRQRQVALLGAIGLGRGVVFAVFLLQALFVGVAGIAFGCCGGYALIRYFQADPIFEMTGFVIRPLVTVETFAMPALLVLAATLLAGVLPAVRAARLDPARILRGAE